MKKKLKTSRVREKSLRILLDSKRKYSQYYKKNPNSKRFQTMLVSIETNISDDVQWFSQQLENAQMSIFCEKSLQYKDISHPVVTTNFDKKGTVLVEVSVLNYGIPVEQVIIPFNKIWIKEQK